VRQKIYVESQQRERKEPRRGAKHFLCGKKYQQRKQKCKEGCCQSHPQQDLVRIVFEKQVLAVKIRFVFKGSILELRNDQRQTQYWQRRNQFHQWWMFGIQTIVGRLPHHVSRKDVIVFVPSDRVGIGGKSELQKENG
jgi:hypothetical protein